ncbi:lambda-crystallin-like [Physella acuta]|uniref:lambda-crystallin-like n=1 Tax=Physella acuta TaxID=109671 RepID=UPI0027DE185F|nr:lambda-crystallin-like [Physella acuta]
MSQQKIGVVGSGLIGRSFSMIYASAGYKVVIYDIQASQLESAQKDIWQQLVALEGQGLLRGTLTKEEQFNNISTTSCLKDCVSGAFLIQECVPEVLDLKRRVWADVDKLVSNDVILSSSTSALLPSAISEGLQHKNRFIISHPTNPPFYAPATEVVPASWTDPDVTERTLSLLKEVGQVPVLIKKEVPGFVLNRIQYAILGECFRLIRDGVVTTEDCDLIMSQGLGVRYAFMGPWETAYLNAEGMYSYSERYADMILNIQKDFGEPARMDGPTLDAIQQSLEKTSAKVEDLPARREWRNKRLIALAKLKQELNKAD